MFIVTKAHESVKLGLVTIALFPEDSLRLHLKARAVELERSSAAINEKIAVLQVNADNVEKREQAALARQKSARMRAKDAETKQYEDGYGPTYDSWENKINAAKTEEKEQGTLAARMAREAEPYLLSIAALREQGDAINSGSFFVTGLPSPIRRTQSDANGDFELQIPSTGSFALVAHTDRRVLGAVEEYTWMVSIPEEAKQGTKLLLSNETLTTEGSPLSLVHTSR